jgi:iron complex outermembrane recepter protein
VRKPAPWALAFALHLACAALISRFSFISKEIAHMMPRNVLWLSLFAGCFFSSALSAQSAADDDEAASDTLQEVVVTATRRAENVQKIPAALSVIDRADVQAIGASGDSSLVLSSRSPSVQAESSFGRTFPRFYIRGLGNTDFDLNASQPVSMVYDDVVLENPTLKSFPLFDLDRVEVLRGPQGTLFGRNTPAGLLKFDSVRPSQTQDAFARIGYGRFGSANIEAAVGGGVNEGSSFRVSALYQRRDDFVDNLAIPGDERGGYEERALRAQWLIEGETFEALMQLRARQGDGGATVFQANVINRGSNQLRSGFRFDETAQDGLTSSFIDSYGLSARLRFNFANTSLTSITALESVEMFARGDVDGGFGASFAPPFGPGFIPFPAESGDGIPEHRQITQEFRLESTTEAALDWQIGALIFDESLELDNISYNTLSGNAINGVAYQEQDNRAYALFGAMNYQLSDALKLSGGLRYTRDSKDFLAQRTLSPIGAGTTPIIRVSPSASKVSGDASLSYQFSDDVSMYARFANGFRAPSIQGRLLFGDVVSVAEDETLNSFEVGMKSELFDRRARLNVAAYSYRVNDLQLTAVGGQTNFNTLINADRADGQGVEADIEALITPQFTLTGGFSYNDTELKDPNLAVQPCGSGCTVLDPRGAVAGTVSIDGNSLPQAPEWTANLVARYGAPLGNGDWYVQSDWSYRTEVNFFLYDSVEFIGDPLLQGGLRLAYQWQGGTYEAAFVGRNILDEIEAIGGVDFNNITGFTNAPRYLGVEFSWRL